MKKYICANKVKFEGLVRKRNAQVKLYNKVEEINKEASIPNNRCSELSSESYHKCKTYEMEHNLGDDHCCYSEFKVDDGEIQKFCILLNKVQYNNIDKFIKDMKKGNIEDYIQAYITKLQIFGLLSHLNYFIQYLIY